MADFFKSAFNYLGGNAVSQDNDFVGQYVELGSQKLRVKRVIAEGGFAFVFVAQDTSSGKEYALKRLLASDEETSKAILQEICFIKKLSGHPNVIEFVSAASIDKKDSDHGQAEFLILTELCTGGDLVRLLRSRGRPLPCDQVLHTFYQVCRAVQHMHKQKPPIIHRDLKVENLLLSARGQIKLCDFGSATTTAHHPDHSWSATRRSLVEDEITKNTTPMYRTPEMLDLYQNFPINEQQDIWALGCILFMMCFNEHPYEDSAKLRIINANYNIPESDTEYCVFHDLLRGTFQVDPRNRPTIGEVIERLQEIAVARNVNLRTPLNIMGEGATESNVEPDPPAVSSPPSRGGRVSEFRDSPHQDRSPQSSGHQALSSSQHQQSSSVGGFFSAFKGGAVNLVKNVKDASSKVMETVSASMNKTDMDISYITSRVAVMSYPAEGIETAFRNHIDDVRNYLETKHPKSYAVYNCSDRTYRVAKFDNRVSECGWPARKAPPLHTLFSICKNMHLWLRNNSKNVCIIHCMDGKAVSATVCGAFLCYCRLFDNASAAMHLFTARRMPPSITPSQKRYMEYICEMLSDPPTLPHSRPVTLGSLSFTPIPLFNRNKSGCRPFVEVFVGEERVMSTSQEYDRMRGYEVPDGKASIPLNCSVQGDVTVVLYHARSTFGGKVQGKITSIKICQFQFHSGFLQPDSRNLMLNRHNLDQLDVLDKYPEGFRISLDYVVAQKEVRKQNTSSPWEGFTAKGIYPKILFADKEEQHLVMMEFGVSERARKKMGHPDGASDASQDSTPTDSPAHVKGDNSKAAPPARPPAPGQKDTGAHGGQGTNSGSGSKGFFDTLEWQDTPSDPKAGEEGEKANSLWQEHRTNLLEDISGEESSDDDEHVMTSNNQKPAATFVDDFADFSAFRASGENSTSPPDLIQSSQAKDSADVLGGQSVGGNFSSNSPMEQKEEAVVDLLNMGGGATPQGVREGISLLDMGGPEPSNFDLLSGTGVGAENKKQAGQGSNASSNVDLFGGFDSFGGGNGSGASAATATQPSSQKPAMNGVSSQQGSNNRFDPFSSVNKPQGQSSPNDFDGLSFLQPDGAKPQEQQQPAMAASSQNTKKNGSGADDFLSFLEDPTKQPGPASDDLMGTWSASNIPRNSSFSNASRNSSTGSGLGNLGAGGFAGSGSNSNLQSQQAKPDPFAGLGAAFGMKSPTGPQPHRPTMGGAVPSQTPVGAAGGMGRGAPMGGSTTPTWQQSPQHQPKPPQQQQATRPTAPPVQKTNYASVIGDRSDRGLNKAFGKPKVSQNEFEHLLDGFSAAKKEEGPKTIKDMRKAQMAEEMDPDKLKVREWSEGKRKNIRALLCSLDQVLWEGENKWKGCGMHELVSANQVKKQFRKAVLVIHPDKLMGGPNENLARNIFYELNDAWTAFEEEGMKSLYNN